MPNEQKNLSEVIIAKAEMDTQPTFKFSIFDVAFALSDRSLTVRRDP